MSTMVDEPVTTAPDSTKLEMMTPKAAPPKRMRGGDGLPSRIEVRLDQPLPPPSFSGRSGYNDLDGPGEKRHRWPDGAVERDTASAAVSAEDNRMQLTQFIAKLGDQLDPQSRDDDIFDMSYVLVRDLRANRDQVIGIIVECGISMPLKQTFYACLIGLLSKTDQSISVDVADCIAFRLNQAIKAGASLTVQMYLLFMTALSEAHVFSTRDLAELISDLIQLGIASTPGTCQGDWAIYTAISTVARSVPDEAIWSGLRDYFLSRSGMATPLPSMAPLTCLRSTHSSVFRSGRDTLQAMYTSLLDTKGNGRPKTHHYVVRTPGPSIMEPLKRCVPCPFSFRISSVGIGYCGLNWVMPCRLIINTGENVDHKLKSSLTDLDAFVLEQQFIDQLYVWHESGRESLMMLTEKALEFNAQQMLIELILSKILDPMPSHIPDIYWRGLTVWCLRACPSIAAFMGRSVHKIFQSLHFLTLESVERFATWFGYHLSNTSFEWPWPAWEHVATEADPLHPQRYFVEMALHQGVRLSYYDCLDEVLAPAPLLRSLLPNPALLPQFDGDDPEIREVVCENIRNKVTFDEVLESASGNLEYVVKCILWHGKKSYSHCFSRLTYYESEIGAAVADLPDPAVFPGWIASFWVNSPQHTVVILDRLIRRFVFHPMYLNQWLFVNYGSHAFSDAVMFTILQNAVDFAHVFDDEKLQYLIVDIVQRFAQLISEVQVENKSPLEERLSMLLRRFSDVFTRFRETILSEISSINRELNSNLAAELDVAERYFKTPSFPSEIDDAFPI